MSKEFKEYSLHTLVAPKNSLARKKRLGRGPGSGLGKTCGRGTKGQKARSGVSIKGFEGGQTPLFRRIPKRGFRSRRIKDAIFSLDFLQKHAEKGTIDFNQDFFQPFLKKGQGVKILASGELTAKIHVTASGFSRLAQEKIAQVGGSITVLEKEKKKPQTSVSV